MEREIILSEPVYLVDNLNIKEFDTAALSTHYLLVIGERHYKITGQLFLLIETIKQYHKIDEIAHVFSQRISHTFSSDEIADYINKELAPKGIIKNQPHEIMSKKSFLYLQFSLFPEKILRPVTNRLQSLFKPLVAKVFIFLIFISHYYAIVNFWSSASFFSFADHPLTLLQTMCLLTISIVFHELGHVSACRYFGVNHREIGFGLYLHIPVFYSNITECWRLAPLQRAVVDIAGIYFQLAFNLLLFFAFLLTAQPVFINAMQWICIQLLFTLNPFLRYDGYWLATDLLGIPNLRKKSRGLLKSVILNYFKKDINNISFLSEIQPVRKFLLFAYAIVSNLFLCIFVCVVFTRFPSLLADFKIAGYELKESLLHSSIIWQDVFMNTYKFLIRAVLLFCISLFGYKLIRSGFSSIFKNIRVFCNR